METLEAVAQGDASAQFALGLMYDEGEGVTQDHKQAARLYRQAAEQGFAKAQNNLGVMYANGDGVEQSYLQAYVWFSIAAVKGHAGAIKGAEAAAEQLTLGELKEGLRMAIRQLEQLSQ